MSLLAHINTQTLVDVHPDIIEDAFPHQYWQYGNDGIIEGTTFDSTVTFKSATAMFKHYVTDADELNNTANQVPVMGQHKQYMLPVLNVDTVGFYRIKTVVSNVEAIIEPMSPSIQLIINRGLGLDLDDNSISEGTELRWSLGGYEEKIALAYSDLLSALIKRNAISGAYLDENDPSYIEALRYHALQLVYTSLIVDKEDNAANLAASYFQLYQKELTLVKPYGYMKKATTEFERC